MALSTDNFRFIQNFARDGAALVLEAGKEYLVEARLTPIARQAGFKTLDAFLNRLRNNRERTMFHDQIIDALTTNETSFFRDFHPFESLRLEVLPQIIAQRAAVRQLSIWSAGSSTGQEAYSIAMLLLEHFPLLEDWNVQILGTDLSATALAQARRGVYSQLEVNRGLPASYLLKYFSKDDLKWCIHDVVKKRVEFRQMNLAKPWLSLPVFDVILVRNVLTYFDAETRNVILKRIRPCLQSQGFLFLGDDETTMSSDSDWLPANIGKAGAYNPRRPIDAAA